MRGSGVLNPAYSLSEDFRRERFVKCKGYTISNAAKYSAQLLSPWTVRLVLRYHLPRTRSRTLSVVNIVELKLCAPTKSKALQCHHRVSGLQTYVLFTTVQIIRHTLFPKAALRQTCATTQYGRVVLLGLRIYRICYNCRANCTQWQHNLISG